MKEQTRRGNPREAIQDPPRGIYVVSLRCPSGWFFNAPWCPGSGYMNSALAPYWNQGAVIELKI